MPDSARQRRGRGRGGSEWSVPSPVQQWTNRMSWRVGFSPVYLRVREGRAWPTLTWETSVGASPSNQADPLPPGHSSLSLGVVGVPFSLGINPRLGALALTVAGQDTCLGERLALSSFLSDATFCSSCWMGATSL